MSNILAQLMSVCRVELSDEDQQSVLNYARLLAQDSAKPPALLPVVRLFSIVKMNAANINQDLTGRTKSAGT